MPPRIVLDTNVLVAALTSSKGASFRLLSIIDSGRFEINVSTPSVAEYEAVLKRLIRHLSAEEIDDVLDYLCRVARHNEIFYLWRPVLKDPDDDFVLELAVKAEAVIVTFNIADFRKAADFGIQVMTPREFLQQIGEIP